MGRKKLKKKKKATGLTIYHYVACLVMAAVLAIFIHSFFPKYTATCANTLSCNEGPKLLVENDGYGIFNNKKVSAPKIDLTLEKYKSKVLGVNSKPNEKHIYVNLKTQTLYAYEGKNLFMKTFISSGKWFPTPTGEFTIWVKIRSTRMSGGSGDDYYDLPNVPYVMFFSNDKVPASAGFSLHGAYWHNNFGHPMSHGCVNMRTTDVAKLYEWATPISDGLTTHASGDNPGTKVTIYDGDSI
ncbi:L,D-transpeptidase [Candidatus Roizmanbacteria bacterium]|nr:L,D-transpeptidase [Candidatus Roizmanbacteria bacterium]